MEKIQREVSGLQVFYIFIAAVSRQLSHISSAASRLQMEVQGSEGRVGVSQIIIGHADVTLIKRCQRGIFSSSAADSLHAFLWNEKCVLSESPAWFPQLRNVLSSHSHGSLLHSVLTSTSRFYWLNRGTNSSKTELPKTLSAVWIQQIPATASLVSAAVVAGGRRSTLQGSL